METSIIESLKQENAQLRRRNSVLHGRNEALLDLVDNLSAQRDKYREEARLLRGLPCPGDDPKPDQPGT